METDETTDTEEEKEVIDSDEEALTAADIFPCADDESDEDGFCDEQDLCPTCIPDDTYPDYLLPKWRNRIRPFLNPKTCHYCITIWTDYTLQDWQEVLEASSMDDPNTAYPSDISTDELFQEWISTVVQESAIHPALAKLAEHYNKDLNWEGPADICVPPGTPLGPNALEPVVDKACSRMGGAATESDDASDEETALRPGEVGTAAYYSINGEVLEEAPVQGQESISWSNSKYFWDATTYQDNLTDEGIIYPYGWVAEREFWYEVETGATDGEEIGVNNLRYYAAADHQNSGQQNIFWEDDSDDTTCLGNAVYTILTAMKTESNLGDDPTYDEYWQTAYGSNDAYNEELIKAYVLEKIDSYRSEDSPLRIDFRGNYYIKSSDGAKIISDSQVNNGGLANMLLAYGIVTQYYVENGLQEADWSNQDINENEWPEYVDTLISTYGSDFEGYSSTINYQWSTWEEYVEAITPTESTEETESTDTTEDTDEASTDSEATEESEWLDESTTVQELSEWAEPTYDTQEEQWQADVINSPFGVYFLDNDLVEAKNWYANPNLTNRIKVMVCVPASVWDLAPEAAADDWQPYSVIDEIEEDLGVTPRLPSEVEFTTEEVADGMFTRVRWLLKHYGEKRIPMSFESDQSCLVETFEDTGMPSVDALTAETVEVPEFYLNAGPSSGDTYVRKERLAAWNLYLDSLEDGPPPYTTLFTSTQLVQQADNLRQFKKNLLDFLDENIPGYHGFSYIAEHNKRTGIEKIKIEFTTKFQIKTVTYNLKGCPPVMLTGKLHARKLKEEQEADPNYIWNPFVNPDVVIGAGWKDFTQSYPQSDPRTMAYVASLPHMDTAAKATTPMEWQDFLTLWTYPRVGVTNYSEFLDNDPPCSSVSDAMEGALNAGWDIFIETLTSKFDQQLCQTIEEGSEAWTDYFARYRRTIDDKGTTDPRDDTIVQSPFVQDLTAATKAAWRDVLVDDPFLENMLEGIEFLSSTKGLWREIFDRLGRCGLLNFLSTLFECLFAGVDFGDILETALQSALKTMDIQFFKRLLIGLPPEIQNQIAETARSGLDENFQDYRPWDSEYPTETEPRTQEAIERRATENAYEAAQEDMSANEGSIYSSTTAAAAARVNAEIESARAVDDADTAVETYIGAQDASNTKTLGAVLVDTGAGEEIREAYADALMEILQPDEILDLLEGIPGFVFLKQLFDLSKCPGVSLFHPPLEGWFNDLSKALSEWDPGLIFWCSEGFYIPELLLDRPFLIWDWIKAIFQLIMEAIEAAIVKALITMLKMLIEWLLELLCKAMGTLGAAALTATGLMSAGEFQTLAKESLCGTNATDAEIEQALGAILSAMGVTSETTEEELNTSGAEFIAYTGDFLRDHPSVDSMALLKGTASTQSLRSAADFYKTSNASFSDRLGNAQTIKSLFGHMGTLIGDDALDKMYDAYLEKVGCFSPTQGNEIPFCALDAARDNTCAAFEALNIPEGHLKDLCDSALDDITQALDIGSIMATGLGNGLGPDALLPTGPGGQLEPCYPNHPGSLIPKDNAASISDMQGNTSDDIEFLKEIYESELIGTGGIFDRILSNCDGIGKRMHDKRLDNLLAQERGANPNNIATYLRDIMSGERTNIEAAGITAADSNIGTGNFTFLEFEPINAIDSHALYGGWSINWPNSLEVYEARQAYCYGYGESALDEFKSGEEFEDPGEISAISEDDDGSQSYWQIIDEGSAYRQDPRVYPSGSTFRKVKVGADPNRMHLYPNPHAVLQFMGTDPSMSKNSPDNAGYPTYHFHYWHEERNGMTEGGVSWESSDDELSLDIAKMHIFEVVPTSPGAGIPDKKDASSIGEYTLQLDEDRRGNIRSLNNGHGPLSVNRSSAGNSALDPIIRTVRTLDSEIIDYISSLEISVDVDRFQRPTIWAKTITDSLATALIQGGTNAEEAYDSMLSPITDLFYDQEYSKLSKDFMQQYSAQIVSDDNSWKSGLLNFELVQLTEDECIDVGLSKFKGDDTEKEEVALRRRRKKNITEGDGYADSNDYGDEWTGYYRPEMIPGTEGISEIVDLPETEYGVAAFYIHQQYQKGWARLVDEYLPGPGNPCPEQINADIFNWQALADHKMEAYQYLDDDERVSSNPSCVWDPPYNRVNTRESRSSIEMLIKAAMRTTIHENLIKAMPAYLKFNVNTGCFGDLLPAYMFKSLRQSIFDQSKRRQVFGGYGKLRTTERRYDYAFLEQCCNMYVGMIARGEVERDDRIMELIDKIDEYNSRIYRQPNVDWFQSTRKATRRKVLEETEPWATEIAQRIFQLEFESCTEKFANWSCPEVDNLQKHFLEGGLNLQGAATSALTTDVADPDELRFGAYTYDEDTGMSIYNFSGDFEYLENGGFVIEKYIRIEEKADYDATEDIASGREDSKLLYGICNLEAWDEWVAGKEYFGYSGVTIDEDTGEETAASSTRKIGDLFESWSYGLRICYVPSPDIRNNESFTAIFDRITEDTSKEHMAYRVESPSPYQEGAVFVPLIPIASTEVEIPGDLRIGDFNIVEDYDFECLMNQFVKEEPQFRTLFEYVFPLDRMLSVSTIYMNHCFLHSISLDDNWYQNVEPGDGNVGDPVDGWMRRKIRQVGHDMSDGMPGLKAGDMFLFTQGLKRFSGYRHWPRDSFDQHRCFTQTKETIRDMFMGEYNFKSNAMGDFGLPSFNINFSLPPFGFGLGKWFGNRMLEGPDCEADASGIAAQAAFNRQ